MGTYLWHAIAILRQYFVYFYNIYLHLYAVNVWNFYWRIIHDKWKKTLKLKFRPYQGHFWLISGPCSGNLYNIYIPKSMELFKFSLYCLARPTGDYFKYQIIRTIAGPCSGYMVAKLSGQLRAILGPFNYSYTIRTCKKIVNGYCWIVWWYFATWGHLDTPGFV